MSLHEKVALLFIGCDDIANSKIKTIQGFSFKLAKV